MTMTVTRHHTYRIKETNNKYYIFYKNKIHTDFNTKEEATQYISNKIIDILNKDNKIALLQYTEE